MLMFLTWEKSLTLKTEKEKTSKMRIINLINRYSILQKRMSNWRILLLNKVWSSKIFKTSKDRQKESQNCCKKKRNFWTKSWRTAKPNLIETLPNLVMILNESKLIRPKHIWKRSELLKSFRSFNFIITLWKRKVSKTRFPSLRLNLEMQRFKEIILNNCLIRLLQIWT